MSVREIEVKYWLLRLFAFSWAMMFALAALLLRNVAPGFALWWLPLLVTPFFVFGLIAPVAMRRPYRLIERLLTPVGRVFALLMLALVYFGVFTPFALILRLVGWNPLRRRRSHWPASGWVPRNKAADAIDYRWQY